MAGAGESWESTAEDDADVGCNATPGSVAADFENILKDSVCEEEAEGISNCFGVAEAVKDVDFVAMESVVGILVGCFDEGGGGVGILDAGLLLASCWEACWRRVDNVPFCASCSRAEEEEIEMCGTEGIAEAVDSGWGSF